MTNIIRIHSDASKNHRDARIKTILSYYGPEDGVDESHFEDMSGSSLDIMHRAITEKYGSKIQKKPTDTPRRRLG